MNDLSPYEVSNEKHYWTILLGQVPSFRMLSIIYPQQATRSHPLNSYNLRHGLLNSYITPFPSYKHQLWLSPHLIVSTRKHPDTAEPEDSWLNHGAKPEDSWLNHEAKPADSWLNHRAEPYDSRLNHEVESEDFWMSQGSEPDDSWCL
ncbi:hypothetical protein Hdeb2414_s0010g00335951 [Helianthus debilis subsp. tardiflorus]